MKKLYAIKPVLEYGITDKFYKNQKITLKKVFGGEGGNWPRVGL